ncbi:MAG: TauD/TfdA family dioxygenase, partial [Pseudomonadota bacterium]
MSTSETSAAMAVNTAARDAAPGSLKITPITDAVGAHVHGVDLARVDARTAAHIEAAFDRYGALLFRNQTLAAADLVRFSRHFGDLDEAPVNEAGKTAVDGHPEVYVVS